MFNKSDITRDACQLFGAQARKGYDWWWHSFTAYDAETGAAKGGPAAQSAVAYV